MLITTATAKIGEASEFVVVVSHRQSSTTTRTTAKVKETKDLPKSNISIRGVQEAMRQTRDILNIVYCKGILHIALQCQRVQV